MTMLTFADRAVEACWDGGIFRRVHSHLPEGHLAREFILNDDMAGHYPWGVPSDILGALRDALRDALGFAPSTGTIAVLIADHRLRDIAPCAYCYGLFDNCYLTKLAAGNVCEDCQADHFATCDDCNVAVHRSDVHILGSDRGTSELCAKA